MGPLQDSQLNSDFSGEIKIIFVYYIHLKSKNQVLKDIPTSTLLTQTLITADILNSSSKEKMQFKKLVYNADLEIILTFLRA